MERYPGNYEQLSDSDLVARVKESDQLAFTALWKRHHAKSLVVARGIVRNDEDAQEVVQEAWLNAWRYLARFEANANFTPWLAAIVRNLSLMKLRALRRRRAVACETELVNNGGTFRACADVYGNPEAAVEKAELHDLLRDQLARIRLPYRECLVVAYLEDYMPADAARRLNLTESALKTRLRRGRAELVRRMRTKMKSAWHASFAGEVGLLQRRSRGH